MAGRRHVGLSRGCAPVRVLLVLLTCLAGTAAAQIGPAGLVIPQPFLVGTVAGAYQSQAAQTNSGTFSSMSFGAASTDRYLVCVCTMSSASTLTSVTIGGVSATTLASLSNSTNQMIVAIAAVPTGTTGNVVLNGFSGSGTMYAAIYSVRGTTRPTSGASSTSASSSFSTTLNVAPGSFVIGTSLWAFNNSTFTWTGVTQDATDNVSTSWWGVASTKSAGGGSALSLGVTQGGAGSNPLAVFVSIPP